MLENNVSKIMLANYASNARNIMPAVLENYARKIMLEVLVKYDRKIMLAIMLHFRASVPAKSILLATMLDINVMKKLYR